MSRARKPRGRGYFIGLLITVGTGLVCTFVLGRTYSELALQKEPFDRLSYVPSFDPIEDATLGLSPNASNVVAATPNPQIRAVRIFPSQVIMVAGGKAVRTIETKAPPTLRSLADVVNDPSWLAVNGGTITVKSAVIVENGSAMSIAAPTTTEVNLQVRPGVFLAASSASLQISGVYVHASDSNVPTTLATPQQSQGRPFILAVDSTMNVDHTTLRYLGRDWNSSYGLSWSKGSTGSVTDSLFEHNFIGVYTNGSPSLLVRHNTLTHNSLYGVDPHSGSTHMTIIDNISNYNGRHGIIFSDHVTQGLVQGNTTIGNGLNGIMMDEASTANTISGNTVQGNKSDGIVLANSSSNVVEHNSVLSNRIGITVRGNSDANVIRSNSVRHNRLATQGFHSSGNHLASNGGEWIGSRIQMIWLITGAVSLLVLALTRLSQRGDRRSTPSGVTPRIGVAA